MRPVRRKTLIWSKGLCSPFGPSVFAGEEDVGPSEGRDVRQKVRRAIQFRPATSSHSFTKMLGVPIDDDGGEQVQPDHPEMLPLSCSISDFALAPDA